ncbi:hypothetical protein CASFOL_024360 [Castilleja foliolosa]|uniref:FAR1 domain-containing protein n=1 Tax=Castilleja foliolosa TaxID=1961234 RepID=A0ABD3CR63_9LAMI
MGEITGSSSGREPCRRLDFDHGSNFPITDEVIVVDMDHENDMNDHVSTHHVECIDTIHARINKDLIPVVGMEFETEEMAHQFYLTYAKAVGFGVRFSRAHKEKASNKILDRVFCCAREGERKKDVRDAQVKYHRPLSRCNCSAEMKISCRQTDLYQLGNYRIVKFIAGHNHDCVTPSKIHLIRSHRKITEAQKAEVDIAIGCGIAPRETMEFLAKHVGGREHLGFIADDCRNYLRSKRTNTMRTGDTGGVLQYLQRKQAEDPNFLYAIQVDEEDLITNIFWADAKMRSDYSHFGDVVCFDTTYILVFGSKSYFKVMYGCYRWLFCTTLSFWTF